MHCLNEKHLLSFLDFGLLPRLDEVSLLFDRLICLTSSLFVFPMTFHLLLVVSTYLDGLAAEGLLFKSGSSQRM